MTGVASRAIAGCFALAAFSVAVMAGLAGGNTATSILMRALFAMAVCYPLGLLVGFACRHAIEQHLGERPSDRPGEAGKVGAPIGQSTESAENAEDVLVV